MRRGGRSGGRARLRKSRGRGAAPLCPLPSSPPPLARRAAPPRPPPQPRRPPDAIGRVIGLAARAVPAASELALLDESTRERLRQQVPGWRVVAGPGGAPAVQQEWAVKDAESAGRLVDSINALAAEQGHAPARVEAVGTTVVALLSTAALGEARSEGSRTGLGGAAPSGALGGAPRRLTAPTPPHALPNPPNPPPQKAA
jgi:hypothetical protein